MRDCLYYVNNLPHVKRGPGLSVAMQADGSAHIIGEGAIAMRLDFTGKTTEGIARDVAGALSEAAELGYRQAMADIRRLIGV